MYIYFDENGTIKEVVNDKSIRQGSNEANKLYCYIEGNPSIDDIWYLQKNVDGSLTNEISFKNSTVTKAIPYDAKRDMRYFKDFETYTFYVFTLTTNYLKQSGLVSGTIRIEVDNEIFALGELKFNVQENVINTSNNITQSQYDYLLLAYASRTLNEETGSDLDHLLDEKIDAKIGDIADGSPKVFDTTAHIQALTSDMGLAVATDTGYIWVWNDTDEEYKNTNYVYLANVSAYYTKTEADNTFAPKSTAITHTGNQLQDYSGNDIQINKESILDNNVLKNNVVGLANNTDLNTIKTTGSYYITSDKTYTNSPVTNGLLIVFYNVGAITTQIIFNYSNNGEIYTRRAYNDTWNSWSLQPIPNNSVDANKIVNGSITSNKMASNNVLINNLVLQTNTDLDNVKTTGTYYLTTDRTYTNLPKSLSTASGLLVVIKSVSNIVTQIFYVYRTGQTYYRTFNGFSWRNWFNISLNNYWCGKKITILGTSVSFGQYDTESYNNFASKELGFELINASIPGLAIQTDSNGDSLQYGSSSLSIAEYEAQGITIADEPIPYTPNGQHNNYYSTYEHIFETQADLYVYDVVPNNVDFSLTDWNAFDKDNWIYSDNSSFADHRKTFLGALLFLMDRMYATNANARMVFVISSKFSYDAGKTALETIANYYKIPIINLWGNINATPKALQYLYVTYNTNQHPSTKAQEIMGKMFVHKLMEIA